MRVVLIISALTALAAFETTALAAPTAEDLYVGGQAAYDRADYATAIARWQDAHELSGENGLLFNLAQAMRLSGDCRGALAAYKRFVANSEASEQHKLAEDLVRELEPRCEAPDPQPTFVEVHEVGRPGRTLKIGGLVTGGSGVALVATGLLFGRRAKALGQEITSACASSCGWDAWKGNHATGRRYTTIGYALDAVGVAAIMGGAVMYYLGDRRSVVTVSLRSREDVVVSWGGSW